MCTGSFIPDGTPDYEYERMRVLTADGVRAKHKLSRDEFETIRSQLLDMKLRDVLFHFPDDPRYDIAIYLVATTR